MHNYAIKRLSPLALVAAVFLVLAAAPGCVKQPVITMEEGQFPPVEEVVTIAGVETPKIVTPPPPPPAPKPEPVPVPVPEPTATASFESPAAIIEEHEAAQPEVNTLVVRRSYLIPTKEETQYDAFGLCSYVVLPHMYPSDQSGIYDRYIKLHQAFKAMPQYMEKEHEGPAESNVLYWNLSRGAFGTYAHEIFAMEDSFYVKNYDYSRAAAILDIIDGLDPKGGPFIVGRRNQLDMGSQNAPEDASLLILDLSRVQQNSFKQLVANYVRSVMENQANWASGYDVNAIEAACSQIPSQGKPVVLKAKWLGSKYRVVR